MSGNLQAKDKYLFVYFTGEQEDGEQVYFSVSRDAFYWDKLNGGDPVLRSEVGERGVRDPFLLRAKEGDHFFLIATDLRIASGKGWAAAQRCGSRSIIIWESKDLVHWEKERSVEVGLPEAGCVWAPEAIYDEKRDAYMVFWASMVQEKHRIYRSYTKDFRTFSKPQCYIEEPKSVIDTTIVCEDGVFYRFSKDETSKTIKMEAGEDLLGAFHEIHSETLKKLKGVEGPAAFPLPNSRSWCLMVDRFAEGKGYLPLLCSNLSAGDFQTLPEDTYDLGGTVMRHGSVLTITEEEYQRLILRWGTIQNPIIPGLYADPDLIKAGDTFYLYPTTDGFAHWAGTQIHAFSSHDLTNWTDRGVILDLATEQVPWAVGYAWAPAVCQRNGKFYIYFCGKRLDGVSCIGVAVSDSPVSGFTAMDEALLTPELLEKEGVKVGQVIDPSIYEEDGKVWLLFGNGQPAIAELTDDLLGICPGSVRNLEGAYDFREAITVLKKDGLYHFTWSCEDTGDENYHVNYGISENLHGPIRYQYPVLCKAPERDILGTGHHSILKIDADQYVMAYHRFATPTADYPSGKGFHRELCLGRVTFSGGRMQPVEP